MILTQKGTPPNFQCDFRKKGTKTRKRENNVNDAWDLRAFFAGVCARHKYLLRSTITYYTARCYTDQRNGMWSYSKEVYKFVAVESSSVAKCLCCVRPIEHNSSLRASGGSGLLVWVRTRHMLIWYIQLENPFYLLGSRWPARPFWAVREAFFGSRQIMVARMNGRAGAKNKTYDSGGLLSSADASYQRCLCQRNASLWA